MLEGLTAFNEGLVEHGLLDRSKKNNETLNQAIKREISDMARLIPELHRIDDSSKKILTEGIIKHARGFYLIMRSNGIENIPRNYKKTVKNIGKYFESRDNKYYSELEGKSDDMEQLIKYLNELNF